MTIMLSLTSVFAARAESSRKTVTTYGKTYQYYSVVVNDSSSTWAYGCVEVKSGGNVPTGYYGINARLYTSSGTLVKSSGWKYNDSASAGTSEYSGDTYTKGTYYGKGQMQFYNGNGYSTYTSNASPNIQRSVMSIEKTYKLNERGLTYGSDYFVEDEKDSPDLIRVIGVNGLEGYVYSTELNKCPKNINEVEEYIKETKDGYTIPVYEKDGMKIIDQFNITMGEIHN